MSGAEGFDRFARAFGGLQRGRISRRRAVGGLFRARPSRVYLRDILVERALGGIEGEAGRADHRGDPAYREGPLGVARIKVLDDRRVRWVEQHVCGYLIFEVS